MLYKIFSEKCTCSLSASSSDHHGSPEGRGYSSKTLQGNTIKRHARDIHELIRHLELKDAILLGWSVGASVVTTYAADYKEEGLADWLSWMDPCFLL